MKRDFNTWVLFLVFGMPLLFIAYIAGIYFVPCGLNADCSKADLPVVIHTPIPTLIPATLPVPETVKAGGAGSKCAANARTLLSAWVNSGYKETVSFQFTDNNGSACQASYAEIKTLFQDGNLWYTGAPACITCHNSNLASAAAQMDLSSYAGIVAGSRRTSAGVKGNDILGGGTWDKSKLNDMLFIEKKMPLGRPADAVAPDGPVIYAGSQVATISGSPTPTPSTNEVARPSNPGGPGDAINLAGDPLQGEVVYKASCASCHGEKGVGGLPNPGSTDGTIPPLNPIDSSLVDPNYLVYATNIDLFIQNGSTPEGPNPTKSMAAWGSQNKITQQQIADVIAYIIGINGGPAATTPTPPTAEVARPSNPGGPGDAINLTGAPVPGELVYQVNCASCHGVQGLGGLANPGSTDGTIPPLNPIDATLVDPNYKIYATNIDLFIQHGSTPGGPNPAKLMAAWGDQNKITQQQIADVIAYIISLNNLGVARPSNPGGPGDAINLTGDPVRGDVVYKASCASCHGDKGIGGLPNPGSTDGTIPPLKPIDSTLVDPNYIIYAANIDLFIQHGSTPAGPNPAKLMPAWGDQNKITQLQIADVIAYIISLNK